MPRSPVESLVEARIAERRERAFSNGPQKPRHNVLARRRRNRHAAHAAASAAFGRFATTDRC